MEHPIDKLNEFQMFSDLRCDQYVQSIQESIEGHPLPLDARAVWRESHDQTVAIIKLMLMEAVKPEMIILGLGGSSLDDEQFTRTMENIRWRQRWRAIEEWKSRQSGTPIKNAWNCWMKWLGF